MKKISLILLPGLDGTGLMFEPFVAALGNEFDIKVVAYPASQSLGYAELEVIAREALPKEGPYVILGESFSGPIAISLAASASTQLVGLILCCTFVRNPRPIFTHFGPLVDLLPFKLVPLPVIAHFLFGRFSTDSLRKLLARTLAQVSFSVLRKRLKEVIMVDVSAKLEAVSVPLLYLRAKHDCLVPSNASTIATRLNPHAQVVEIDGPHSLLQAVPTEAAQIVAAFLRKAQNGT
ncbi:MAG: alpha/beta fold hydrolase [Methylophilus sp.]